MEPSKLTKTQRRRAQRKRRADEISTSNENDPLDNLTTTPNERRVHRAPRNETEKAKLLVLDQKEWEKCVTMTYSTMFDANGNILPTWRGQMKRPRELFWKLFYSYPKMKFEGPDAQALMAHPFTAKNAHLRDAKKAAVEGLEPWWFPGIECATRTTYPSAWNHFEGDVTETETSNDTDISPIEAYEASRNELVLTRVKVQVSLGKIEEVITKAKLKKKTQKEALVSIDSKLNPWHNAARLAKAILEEVEDGERSQVHDALKKYNFRELKAVEAKAIGGDSEEEEEEDEEEEEEEENEEDVEDESDESDESDSS